MIGTKGEVSTVIGGVAMVAPPDTREWFAVSNRIGALSIVELSRSEYDGAFFSVVNLRVERADG